MSPSPTASGDDAKRLLGIYLNDHLAGSAVGVELARRLRDSNEGEEEFGPALAEVCAEIEADRQTLMRVMERNGIRRGRLKPAAGRIAEKLGRLKPNARLRSYSPLSRLIEVESLYIGVTGKLRLWTALERALGPGPGEFDFPRLAERAARQLSTLEELHSKAAKAALAG